MPLWKPTIALDGADAAPIFLRIARAIEDDVRRGRLARGSAVPGSRALAESLGVHRNTVLAAYRELVAEGWLTVEPARGTFVSSELPDVRPKRFARAPARAVAPVRAGFDMPAGARHDETPLAPGVLQLRGGVPDVRLVPAAALARAYRRTLRLHGRAALSYGDPRGVTRLRVALAEMLSAARGLAATPDALLVTRGSQMALDLAARALLRPGDAIAIEALGYRYAWDALAGAGARLVPVPVDAQGMRIDALRAAARDAPLRAIYVTPHHQYPTTVVLAAARRLALLDFAREHRVPILEDDYDHEFHYEGRPVLPLASADQAGVVVYMGTLSKVLAPGLRAGYVVAPPPLLARMTALRVQTDRQGDHVSEHALAELFEDGEVQRHARRARRIYHTRRDALVAALTSTLGSALSFEAPAGGTAIWAAVDPAVDVEAWGARALAGGVHVQTAKVFTFDRRPRPFMRLGFAALDEREMREAVRRLARALPPS